MNHPLAIFSQGKESHKPWAYLAIGVIAYLSIFKSSKKELVSNPVLTSRQEENAKQIYKFLLDNNIKTDFLVEETIKSAAEDAETIEQFDVLIKLYWLEDSIEFLQHGIKPDGYELLPKLKHQLFQKVTEFIIKNFRVDEDLIRSWRHCNRDFDVFLIRGSQYIRQLRSIHVSHILGMKLDMIHYIDLMRTQEGWDDLAKIKWGHKRFTALYDELKKLHDEINRKLQKKTIRAKPKPSHEFLKVHDKLKWFLVPERECNFESEALGHCGVASQGCYLLSLREFSTQGNFPNQVFDEPIWVPRVTATVCPEKITDDIMTDKYMVTEILSVDNSTPDKKWDGAIYKLYKDPRIDTFKLRSKQGHHPQRLDLKKQTKLLETKPEWDTVEAKMQRRLARASKQDFVDILFESLEGGREESLIREAIGKPKIHDNHVLFYEHEDLGKFADFLEYFMDRENRQELNLMVEAYEEPYEWTDNMDFYSSFRDIDHTDYLKYLSDKQLKKLFGTTDLREIEKSDVPEEIKDAIVSADADGWRTGYESQLSSAAYNYLKEITFNSRNRENVAFVDHNRGKWQFWLELDDLKIEVKKYGADFLSSDFLHDVRLTSRDRWRIEGDFDESIAKERFLELIGEIDDLD